MSITNAYWAPPATQEYNVTQYNPKVGDLGFRHALAWPLPVTVGAQYFGEGQQDLPIYPKRLNTSTRGETFAVGNTVPSSGGVPLINIYDAEYKFARNQTDREFKTAFGVPN